MDKFRKLPEKIIFAIKSVIGRECSSIHEPTLKGSELVYLKKCIKTNYVSSVGPYVKKFENKISKYTKSKYSIATVNGTSALHIALMVAGIKPKDEVLIPSLNFIASANATIYCNAVPHFIDVEKKTLGVDADKLSDYLKKNTRNYKGLCINKRTNRVIRAIVPTHTFGHPFNIQKIIILSKKYNLKFIEDAAESLGSFFHGKHTGTFGDMGILSFNGNKTITTGGGGIILTNNKKYADQARHLTSTAKKKHSFELIYNMIGYNYRLPNINAAIGCAQLEQIELFLKSKRKLLKKYKKVFKEIPEVKLFIEPKDCKSNYWLQTIILNKGSFELRNLILKMAKKKGIALRPVWKILTSLPHFKFCPHMDVSNSKELEKKIINLPSSSHLGFRL